MAIGVEHRKSFCGNAFAQIRNILGSTTSPSKRPYRASCCRLKPAVPPRAYVNVTRLLQLRTPPHAAPHPSDYRLTRSLSALSSENRTGPA